MHDPEHPADLIRFIAEPTPCSYLDGETSQLEYRVPRDLDTALMERLLSRGWRRFGNYVFRPQCPNCSQCRSLRIPVSTFEPSKGQRRTLRRNAHIEVRINPPGVTDEHIALFNSYHQDMTARRDWKKNRTSAFDYYESFIGNRYEFALEFQYRDQGRLVGVGLVDAVADATSSMYFYHDPAWRPLGPGTFSILTEIEWARSTGRSCVYLGYWIRDNQSMTYKSRFQPHELLAEYIDDNTIPEWKRPLPLANESGQ